MKKQPSVANSPDAPASVHLANFEIKVARIRLVGDSSLIVHNWSEKAKREMSEKQGGVASAGRKKRVPEDEFESSKYLLSDGRDAFPAIAFKAAAVGAGTTMGKNVMSKVAIRQAFHIVGDLVPIQYEGDPVMRSDMVRVGNGAADIRYRAEYWPWSVEIELRFNARLFSLEQILTLFNAAGFAVGVGEWRPERNGPHGMFHVEAV